jgi:hypothetical protein
MFLGSIGIVIDNDVRVLPRRLAGENFLVEGGRRFLLPPLRNFASFVRMLRIARRTSGLFDVLFDHCDDGMVGEPSLAWTVVVQYVTETQPALLHSTPPRITV